MRNSHVIDQRVQSYIDSGEILGLSLAIIDGDQITYARGFGVTNIDKSGTAVSPDTLFAYGSISNVITATVIMRLVDDGLLELDKPVVDYLPGFTFLDQEIGDKVTLRQILSHTSGLPSARRVWGQPNQESLKHFIWEELSTYSFIAQPGRIHLYNDTAYLLASYIAEIVSGKNFHRLSQELVLTPLEMTSTTYDPSVAMTHPIALPHKPDANGRMRTFQQFGDYMSSDPSGIAFGTALDLANLAIIQLNLGIFQDKTILSLESIEEMQTFHADRHIPGVHHPLMQTYSGYGLGLMLGHYKSICVARHEGKSMDYNCFFDLFTDEKLGLILLTNYSKDESLTELVNYLYDTILNLPHKGTGFRPPPEPASGKMYKELWPQHEGSYLNVENGSLVWIKTQNGELTIEQDGRIDQLNAISMGEYYREDAQGGRTPVVFLLETDIPTKHLIIGGNPYQRINLNLDFSYHLDAWTSFQGLYKHNYAQEISGIKIYLSNGSLQAETDGGTYLCSPLNANSFLCDLGLIEFEPNGNGSNIHSLILGKATRYHRASNNA
jgi:CubicO group peptidase (beta-lactamase class C family)